MTTAWEWQWIVGRNTINLTVDLFSLMLGYCIGSRDVVIHIGMATVCIEYWPVP